ncbi:tripartite motif-containing protein 16 [Lepisosteus oculatus]|uniref:tripartite motif-containing protein 16 n=1 Tax=Lepisosteus oculatus TaxID=7918 RepID=UPI00371D7644
MAGSGAWLSDEELRCPLCADWPREPVTLACGDTFCLECIEVSWAQADPIGVYSCPQCRATFTPRPALRGAAPTPPPERLPRPELVPFPPARRDVPCDFCTGRKRTAVKSCLVCLASYCDAHVRPHYDSPAFRGHKLVDGTGHLARKVCPQHEKRLELFCRSDRMCVCALCAVREHRDHDVVSAEEERTEGQKVLAITQAEVQQTIQERAKELEELRHEAESLKSSARRVMADSGKIFAEMIRSTERLCSEANSLIAANEKAAIVQVEGHVQRLEEEIMGLRKREGELRLVLDTEDHIHFLQNYPSLCVPHEGVVPKVVLNPEFSLGVISKGVTDMKEYLEDICRKELAKISKRVDETPVYLQIPRTGEKLLKAPGQGPLPDPQTRTDFLKYSCRLSFDPCTAFRELSLSAGNRRAIRKRDLQVYPDHPERFDCYSQVLCQEALSGHRYYWEAEGSGEFTIGVAYKSIRRKGKTPLCLLGYNDKSWSLLCSETGYSAWHNQVVKDIAAPHSATRIGVYVDYAGGSMSFYNVSESMRLIHTFHATFTEPLCAGFGVGSSVTICQLK